MKYSIKSVSVLLFLQVWVPVVQGASAPIDKFLPKSRLARPARKEPIVTEGGKQQSPVEWVYVVERLLNSLNALKSIDRAERESAAHGVARNLEEGLSSDFKLYSPIQAIIAFLKETDERGFSAYTNTRLNILTNAGFGAKVDLLKGALLEAVKSDYPDVFAIIVMPPDMRNDVIKNMLTEVSPDKSTIGRAVPHVNRETKPRPVPAFSRFHQATPLSGSIRPPMVNRTTKSLRSAGAGAPPIDRSTKWRL